MKTKKIYYVDATLGSEYFWEQINDLYKEIDSIPKKKTLWQKIKAWF